MKKKKIVVPGEQLATAEEYVPGRNTFEDNEGNIVSVTIGVPEFDEQNREVDVESQGRKVLPLEPGAIILGRVALVKESSAVIEIFEAEKNGIPRVVPDTHASLMVSKVARGFVKNLSDEFKIGDIVKAKLIKVTPYSKDLATDFPEYGVIKAFCSNCKKPLHLFSGQLKCLSCGSLERRKISKDYYLK